MNFHLKILLFELCICILKFNVILGPVPDVKLADLNVPISSIKPGKIPPMNLVEGGEDGISIVLHFGRDQPREHVTAIVVTIISKMTEPLTDFELKAVVPKGKLLCHVSCLLLKWLFLIYYYITIKLSFFQVVR